MTQAIPTDQIVRRPDARSLDDATVRALAESIGDVGLINAIRVRDLGGRFELVAGAHRLAACARLGLVEIECVVVDDDDLHAELAMIDENLCRAELSPSDRARQTARRKAIYLELHPSTAQYVAGGAGNRTTENISAVPSFASDTAAATGQTDRIVRLHAERGSKVIEEVLEMVRGTHLDTGAYLDKIKNLTPNEQVAAARRDLRVERSRHTKPVEPSAPPLNDFEVINRDHRAMVRAWDAAHPDARERFLSDIGAVLDGSPVMDAGRFGT